MRSTGSFAVRRGNRGSGHDHRLRVSGVTVHGRFDLSGEFELRGQRVVDGRIVHGRIFDGRFYFDGCRPAEPH